LTVSETAVLYNVRQLDNTISFLAPTNYETIVYMTTLLHFGTVVPADTLHLTSKLKQG